MSAPRRNRRTPLLSLLLSALFLATLQTPLAAQAPSSAEQPAAEQQPAEPTPLPSETPTDALTSLLAEIDAMRASPGSSDHLRRASNLLAGVNNSADLADQLILFQRVIDAFDRETVVRTVRYAQAAGATPGQSQDADRQRLDVPITHTTQSAPDGTPITLSLTFTQSPGGWRIAPASLISAQRASDLIGLHPLEALLRGAGMGEIVDEAVLGVRYYQWIGLALIIFLAVTFDFILRSIVRVITRRYIRKEEDGQTQSDTSALVGKLARPLGLTGGAILAWFLIALLELPITADQIFRTATKALALLAGTWSIYRLVDVVAEFFARRAAKTKNTYDDLLIPLIRKAIKIFVVAYGLVFIAESFSLPITSLVAGLGIGGLAFAFAAKDTIENFFGSVAVIVDSPFVVGDWIVVGDVEGTVEELGFRSTRVRTFYNSLVTVPNATLVRATVDNYGKRRFRRFRTMLQIEYGTPPDTIEAFCEGVREIVRQHPYTRKDYYEVHLNGFGAHSLDILLYVFFRVPDWSVELQERQRLMLDIIRLAQKLGVAFAFPTQTLHIQRVEDGAPFEGRASQAAARDEGKRAADQILSGSPWKEQQ